MSAGKSHVDVMCPRCGTVADYAGDTCPECGADLPFAPYKAPADPTTIKCRGCGTVYDVRKMRKKICPACGVPLRPLDDGKCAAPPRAPEQPKQDPGPVRCPDCGSTQIQVVKKGFGFGKAAAGGLLAGPLGLLAGGIGAGKIERVCINCGRKF